MVSYIPEIIKERQKKRHYVRVMAFAVLGMLVGGFTVHEYINTQAQPVVEELSVENSEETNQVSVFERSAPTRLIIPEINLDTTFVPPLGLNEDQTISVPDSYEKVGWYKHGATPGEVGPSVILGHVDSYEGAAVFYLLGQLEEGDEVSVERADGTTATFVVTEMDRVSQDNFPTQEVYGKVDYAGLRLVTCTGSYDREELKYSHNLIVYAELKEDMYLEE